MDSLKQFKTNSCLGFFPLTLGIYLIFMVMFCGLTLQSCPLFIFASLEILPFILKLIYLMPGIFLVAAVIGIYGIRTAQKEFLIPVLIVIIISIITTIACALTDFTPFFNNKKSYSIACIVILPYGYFWFVIFSLYLHWS